MAEGNNAREEGDHGQPGRSGTLHRGRIIARVSSGVHHPDRIDTMHMTERT